MDHLPLPADPLLGHPQIEYRCDPNFRLPIDCPLLDYPAKKGLDRDAVLTTGRLGDLDSWQSEGFVQEWLFFGVLSKVLDIPGILIQHTDFVTKGLVDRDMLTTTALPAYVWEWAVREGQASPEARTQHALQVQAVLEDAKLIIDRLYSNRSDDDLLGPAGFVHIALCETLEYAAIRIYGRVFPASGRKSTGWRRSEWPARRMRLDGWCPNRVQTLSSLLSSSAMYYASMLRLDHSTVSKHVNCSTKRCNVHHLEKDRYRPKHVTDSCECEQIGPPEEILESALAHGHIPLVRLVMDAEKGVTIETVESDLQDCPRYVAISHVWSDGKGNVSANTLPTCQLQYIQFLVANTLENDEEKPPLFWIDSLCVPVRGEYRSVAIGRMRRTYESAAKVLVLDGELETASMATSPLECLVRIICSGWMRRLWTLQEGALAKELLFQFRERAVPLQYLIDESQRDDAVDGPANPIVDVVASLQYFQNLKRLDSERVLELVEALQGRTTTKPEDEPVCLAVLLDLDAARIASTAPEHRMAELLQLMKPFPAHLMFAPGRRLTQRYFCWAPASLAPPLGCTLPPPSEPTTPMAMQSPRGLMATLQGLSLPPSSAPLRDTAWFTIENDENRYRLCNLGRIEDDGPSWKDIGLHNMNSPALVLAGCFREGREEEMGALVSIVFKDSKMIVADFVSRVSIFCENGEIPTELAAAATSSETAVLIGEAHHIPVTRWYIR